MCSPEAQIVMTIASTVMNYQNQKNVAKQHAADNRVAEGHYNEAYLYDLSKIDNESGNALSQWFSNPVQNGYTNPGGKPDS